MIQLSWPFDIIIYDNIILLPNPNSASENYSQQLHSKLPELYYIAWLYTLHISYEPLQVNVCFCNDYTQH